MHNFAGFGVSGGVEDERTRKRGLAGLTGGDGVDGGNSSKKSCPGIGAGGRKEAFPPVCGHSDKVVWASPSSLWGSFLDARFGVRLPVVAGGDLLGSQMEAFLAQCGEGGEEGGKKNKEMQQQQQQKENSATQQGVQRRDGGAGDGDRAQKLCNVDACQVKVLRVLRGLAVSCCMMQRRQEEGEACKSGIAEAEAETKPEGENGSSSSSSSSVSLPSSHSQQQQQQQQAGAIQTLEAAFAFPSGPLSHEILPSGRLGRALRELSEARFEDRIKTAVREAVEACVSEATAPIVSILKTLSALPARNSNRVALDERNRDQNLPLLPVKDAAGQSPPRVFPHTVAQFDAISGPSLLQLEAFYKLQHTGTVEERRRRLALALQ